MLCVDYCTLILAPRVMIPKMRNSRRRTLTSKRVLRIRTGVDPQERDQSTVELFYYLHLRSRTWMLKTRTCMLWSAGRDEIKTTLSLK